MSSELTHLSDEWADEFDVPEPEMWGFLSGCELSGYTVRHARLAALKAFREDGG